MEHTISGKPEFSMAELVLEQGESVVAESGAMVSCTPSIRVKTSMRGGLFAGLKRKALGGESFFVNTYTAEQGRETICLAPSVPGDMMHRHLDNEEFFLQSGAFVASSEHVDLDTKFQGLKGFISGEGLFMLKASGRGDLFFSSYGAIEELSVDDFGGSYTIDTGFIVGFESTLDYRVRTVGGIKSTFFSGEGLVCTFSGTGKVYLQTRAVQPFASWIHPFRRVKSSSND